MEPSWDTVPNTASCTLRYTTTGALPSDTVGYAITDVTSPLIVPDDLPGGLPAEAADIVNGNLHVFQLLTVPESGWPESSSDYLKTIPLSEQTLAPNVVGTVSGISVEWIPVPATDEYEVWRSTSIEGPYVNLSGPVRASRFMDRNAERDTWYYYKVRPRLYASTLSAAGAARRDPLTLHQPRLVSAVDTPGTARRVEIDGNYTYVVYSSSTAPDDEQGMAVIDISNPYNPTIVDIGTAGITPSFLGNTPDGNLRCAAWRLKAQGDFVYYPDGATRE